MEIYPNSRAQLKFGYTVVTLIAWIVAGYMMGHGYWVPMVFVLVWTAAYTWDNLIAEFLEPVVVLPADLSEHERKEFMGKFAAEKQRQRTFEQLVKDVSELKGNAKK